MTTVQARRAGGGSPPVDPPAPATRVPAVPHGVAGWPGGGEGAPPFSLAAATSQASARGSGTWEGKPKSRLPRAENHPCVCTHTWNLHNIETKKAPCSFIGPGGAQCGCKTFTEEKGGN